MMKSIKKMGKKKKEKCGIKLVKIERIKFKKVPVEVPAKEGYQVRKKSSCGCKKSKPFAYKLGKPKYFEDYYGDYPDYYDDYYGGGGGGGMNYAY